MRPKAKLNILTICPSQEELIAKLNRIEVIRDKQEASLQNWENLAPNHNCNLLINCNDCNDSISLISCLGCDNSINCINCIDCQVCVGCVDCNNCVLCVSLTGAIDGYWLFNQQVTHEVIEKAAHILESYVINRKAEYQKTVAKDKPVPASISPIKPKTLH